MSRHLALLKCPKCHRDNFITKKGLADHLKKHKGGKGVLHSHPIRFEDHKAVLEKEWEKRTAKRKAAKGKSKKATPTRNAKGRFVKQGSSSSSKSDKGDRRVMLACPVCSRQNFRTGAGLKKHVKDEHGKSVGKARGRRNIKGQRARNKKGHFVKSGSKKGPRPKIYGPRVYLSKEATKAEKQGKSLNEIRGIKTWKVTLEVDDDFVDKLGTVQAKTATMAEIAAKKKFKLNPVDRQYVVVTPI